MRNMTVLKAAAVQLPVLLCDIVGNRSATRRPTPPRHQARAVGGRRSRRTTNQAMLVAGLTEIGLGALTGWPYALAISDPERAQSLGIRSNARLRQWHLDLIALGGLTVLAAVAVPDLPRRIAWPLTIGAWANANAFGVLVFKPDAQGHPAYRAAVGGSFIAVSWGWCSLAVRAARASA